MLMQRAGTGMLPPPGFTPPLFPLLAAQWNDPTVFPLPSSPFAAIGPATVVLGHNDSEADDFVQGVERAVDPAHAFGWDNESPERKAEVGQVRVEWRPITNAEFWTFWKENGDRVEMPENWVDVEGDIMVCISSLSLSFCE
jgi:hypothetical protein